MPTWGRYFAGCALAITIAAAACSDDAPAEEGCPVGYACTCTKDCAPSLIGPYPCGLGRQLSTAGCAVCCAMSCSTNADCPAPSKCTYAERWPTERPTAYCSSSSTTVPCGDVFCAGVCRCVDGRVCDCADHD